MNEIHNYDSQNFYAGNEGSYLARREIAESKSHTFGEHMNTMMQAMAMFMAARGEEFDVSEDISGLCAERQAYRLAGMFGPDGSRCRYEKRSIFATGARDVVYDASHMACDYRGMGKFTDVYAFTPEGSLTPACLNSNKPVPNTVTGPVDVKDPIFQKTLYDLGWPKDVISGLNTQADVSDAYDSSPFLRALSDSRVPFGETRDIRTAMALKLVPEMEQTMKPDYGKPYAAGFGIRIRAVEDIHDFDDPAVASKIIGHLDVPLGETERAYLVKSGLVEFDSPDSSPDLKPGHDKPAARDMRDLDAAYDDIIGGDAGRNLTDDMSL